MAKFEITWEAAEFEYREKTVSWYWISIIIAALIIAFSVWERNYLFGFFIVIAEILFIVWGNQPPATIAFTLDEQELAIGGKKFYPLKSFEAMSVGPMDEHWSEVVFHSRGRLKTPIKVIVPSETIEALRANLKTILKEVPYEPTFLDSIEKLLRF